jgi:hypothetical protein
MLHNDLALELFEEGSPRNSPTVDVPKDIVTIDFDQTRPTRTNAGTLDTSNSSYLSLQYPQESYRRPMASNNTNGSEDPELQNAAAILMSMSLSIEKRNTDEVLEAPGSLPILLSPR